MPTGLLPILPPEDFWSRQTNAQKFSFDFAPFGAPTEITSNRPEALVAAQLSSRRFSRIVEPGGRAMRIQIVVNESETALVPDDLPERIVYSGLEDWITLSAGKWGHAFGNLQSRRALIFLSPALAENIRIVSRYFIDHYILNFLFTEWAMLHASCVLDPPGRRLIMLVGAHNTGKSTTALRLTRAGYPFLADGMVLMCLSHGRLVVGGYPIGEVKLREDVLAQFPEYSGEAVRVREHAKSVVDLRAVHPERLAESLIVPTSMQLCIIEPGLRPFTDVSPLTPPQAIEAIAPNTVYWNYPAQLVHNTDILHYVLRTATLYRVKLSPDPVEIVTTLSSLT